MDLSALRQQILLSNKTASEKAETFLLKSQVKDLSKDEWQMFIAGIPEDVEKGIGRDTRHGYLAQVGYVFIKMNSETAASIVTEAVVSQVSRDSLHEGVIQGYLEGMHCLHSLGYVHGDIEPRHLCITLEICPAIIDLGEARTLGVCTDSPKKVWSYRGTVRYATNDILSALAGMAESGQVQMQREAKHDLVAFVSF
ncbi:TPA: hypothetical protein ACH3X1_000586 [Trebouxia sp. C0004]